MTQLHVLCFWALVLLVFAGTAHATNRPAEWTPHDEGNALVSQLAYFRDPSGALKLTEARALAEAKRFTPWHSQNELNFGFDTAAYWIRVPLQVRQAFAGHWVLEVLNTHLDELDVFVDGEPAVITGSARPFSSRPLPRPYYTFPLQLDGSQQWAYLRIRSQYALSMPIRVSNGSDFELHRQHMTLGQFMYFGGVAALFFLNACIFITTRDRRFLYYLAYIGLFGLGIFAGNGYGRVFFWQDAARFDQISQGVFLGLAAIAAIHFSRIFLETRSYLQRLDGVLVSLSVILAANVCLMLAHLKWTVPVKMANQALFGLSLIVAAVILFACVTAARQRWERVRIFLFSWQVLWLGVVVASLRAFNIIPSNGFTQYALQISSALEMILLAFAMADLIRLEMRQRDKDQAEAIALRGQIIHLMTQSERTLELQVSNRTHDLQEALQREKELKQRYVRFGSLIAHEFRNPLAVIMSQVEVARRELVTGTHHLERRLSKVLLATEQLRRLFEQWFESDRILNGAYGALRQAPIDVNEWIASTLDLAKQKGMRCRYADHVPGTQPQAALVVQGDRHLVDLAVWNLIENAEKYAPGGAWIELGLSFDVDSITLSVTDQGAGIDDDAAEHIFDEFYRVNQESQHRGLGLGLAMVARIMQMHQGKAGVESWPRSGSRFWLQFPRRPS
ncbi:sensor histidine kinase [Hydrogenophaga sp.]|uniref:sensor histidine kinase n=1 Tax=Hydrogenophaga sp. TaxID=1904254 RepID=UPI00286EA4EC|nr:sensor histidine kinase [Hydrogenophaga sp.]